jgi:hypothetical protein
MCGAQGHLGLFVSIADADPLRSIDTVYARSPDATMVRMGY